MRILGLLLTLLSLSAWAQNTLEITPSVGYRFGGDFFENQENKNNISLEETNSYGLTIAWPFDQKRQAELHISSYNTSGNSNEQSSLTNSDITISYAHIGGSVPLNQSQLPLWLSGGFGISHFSPSDNQLKSESHFSMNLGLHSQIELTNNLSLRFGGKVYGTFFGGEGEILCNNDNCAIFVDSELWLQSELYTGLTFKF